MAFKKAAMQAFKDGFLKAEPVLLEPIETLSGYRSGQLYGRYHG